MAINRQLILVSAQELVHFRQQQMPTYLYRSLSKSPAQFGTRGLHITGDLEMTVKQQDNRVKITRTMRTGIPTTVQI